MIEFSKTALAGLLFLFANSATAEVVPIMYDSMKIYMSAEINYQPLSNGASNRLSQYQSRIQSFKRPLKTYEPFFAKEDGSQNLYKENLLQGTDLSEIYKQVEGTKYKGVIRWGDYHSVVLEHNFPGYGFQRWREDFVCGDECFISAALSQTPENQVFEVMYKSFLEQKIGNIPALPSIDKQSKGTGLKLLPAWKKAGASIANPMSISIFPTKMKEEICLDCNDLDRLSGVPLQLQNSLKYFVEINHKETKEIKRLVESYNPNFNLENTLVPIFRWENGQAVERYVTYGAYVARLSQRSQINTLGYLKHQDYFFLFIENVDQQKKTSQNKSESIDATVPYELLVLKNIPNKGFMPWLTPTGTFVESLIFDPRVMATVAAFLLAE